jgi:periplasmic divalent cation tolerance protein
VVGEINTKQDAATGYIVILVTAGSSEEATKIAGRLLARRKAACVNIVPRVSSVFRWQGNIESGEESLLVVKTRLSLLDDVVALIKQMHSYDVPEIIALPIIGGNQDYLQWIGKEAA